MKTRDNYEYEPGMTLYTRDWSATYGYQLRIIDGAIMSGEGRVYGADGGHYGPLSCLWANPAGVIESIIATLENRLLIETQNIQADIDRWRGELAKQPADITPTMIDDASWGLL